MKLGCMAGVEYKDKIVFSSTYLNGLFELDTKTRKLQFIKTIEGEAWETHLFRKAFLFGEEAWFIPQRGNHVICVDLNTYDIEYFELRYNRKFNETETYPYYYAYIDGLIVDERYLYCVPNGLDSLLVIDMWEHSVSSVNILNNPEQDLIYGAYFYRGKVHLLSQKGLLDKTILVDGKIIVEDEGNLDSTGYLSVVQSGINLYLIPGGVGTEKTKRLARIDLTSGIINYIDMSDASEEYYGGILVRDCLLLLPDSGTDILKMDIKNGISEKVAYPKELENYFKNCDNTARIIASRKKKLISLIHTGFIIEFDEEGDIINYYDVSKGEHEEVQKVILEYKKKNIKCPPIIMKEDEDLFLSEYIQVV